MAVRGEGGPNLTAPLQMPISSINLAWSNMQKRLSKERGWRVTFAWPRPIEGELQGGLIHAAISE